MNASKYNSIKKWWKCPKNVVTIISIMIVFAKKNNKLMKHVQSHNSKKKTAQLCPRCKFTL